MRSNQHSVGFFNELSTSFTQAACQVVPLLDALHRIRKLHSLYDKVGRGYSGTI